MSSKKILRLKTPTRPRQAISPPKQPAQTHQQSVYLQTIIKALESEHSQTGQKSIMFEIRRLTHELQAMRRQFQSQKQMREELTRYKDKLERDITAVQKELRSCREMYELEKHNHRQLRAFYEKREKEWQAILHQHQSILQEFLYKNYQPSYQIDVNKVPPLTNKAPLDDLNERADSEDEKGGAKLGQKKEIRRLKRKSKENITKPEVVYYYVHANNAHDNILHDQQGDKRDLRDQRSRNPQSDDLFDKILRKSFYHLRQKYISVSQLNYNQEMLKLKHAKTTTRERLPKTLKKLQFQFEDERELMFFCEYIEEVLMCEHGQMVGAHVFYFIIEKLEHIETLALTSNSVIERFQASSIITPENGQKTQRNLHKKRKGSDSSVELMVNSVIKAKGQSTDREGEWDSKIRYSESELQNLSNIIFGDKCMGQECLNIEDPPTVDVTTR